MRAAFKNCCIALTKRTFSSQLWKDSIKAFGIDEYRIDRYECAPKAVSRERDLFTTTWITGCHEAYRDKHGSRQDSGILPILKIAFTAISNEGSASNSISKLPLLAHHSTPPPLTYFYPRKCPRRFQTQYANFHIVRDFASVERLSFRAEVAVPSNIPFTPSISYLPPSSRTASIDTLYRMQIFEPHPYRYT